MGHGRRSSGADIHPKRCSPAGALFLVAALLARGFVTVSYLIYPAEPRRRRPGDKPRASAAVRIPQDPGSEFRSVLCCRWCSRGSREPSPPRSPPPRSACSRSCSASIFSVDFVPGSPHVLSPQHQVQNPSICTILSTCSPRCRYAQMRTACAALSSALTLGSAFHLHKGLYGVLCVASQARRG